MRFPIFERERDLAIETAKKLCESIYNFKAVCVLVGFESVEDGADVFSSRTDFEQPDLKFAIGPHGECLQDDNSSKPLGLELSGSIHHSSFCYFRGSWMS